jgi:Putative transposase/Transposase zinc-binding domain
LSVGGILRRYGAAFLRQYPQTPPGVQQVLMRLAACRTKAFGGHVSECSHCGAPRYLYHSCGDRHCPACGGTKRAAWLEGRRAELLPVPYFHVVFTLPHELSALVLGNRRTLYALLLRSSAQTLLDVAADPKHLGARLGVLGVLHTWGQRLEHHPHVHCVVPGGGLSPDNHRWCSSRPNFLFPVKVLGSVFRGKYLEGVRQAYESGELHLGGSTAPLAERAIFEDWLNTLYRKPWVVYAKEPFGNDPEQVLKYLARYTHRVAFSNARLVTLEDHGVTFTYKDYADSCRIRELTLPAVEFVRRFALHVVPGGLVRIRQYGLLANRGRGERLEHCRQLLAKDGATASARGAGAAPEKTIPASTLAANAAPNLVAAATPSVVLEKPGPTLGDRWLALLLPMLFAGLPQLPLTAEGALPLGADRCPICFVGRLRIVWQAPRPRSWELPALDISEASIGSEGPLADTS